MKRRGKRKHRDRKDHVDSCDSSKNKHTTQSCSQPTFLNFEKPYPNHIFTALIWGEDRENFLSNPETRYQGKNICMKGVIKLYQGKPEIILRNLGQVSE